MKWIVASLSAACMLGGCAQDTTANDTTPSTDSSTEPGLSLVAIGDSIPYNSLDDCPGCIGFVDRYADAIESATGKPVQTTNLSQHTGLTLPALLAELDDLEPQLAAADVVVVAIAANSNELNADAPCGAPLTAGEQPDWPRVDETCATAAAEKYRADYETLFSRISQMRTGEPTILRTINRYNDWIGWPDGNLTPQAEQATTTIHDSWNAMICTAAEEHGFGCADIYHCFNGPDGTKASGDLLADDYTHPSDKGNALIAETLAAQGFAPLTQ